MKRVRNDVSGFKELNRDGIRWFLIGVFRVDSVVEKNAGEMIDFMLQNNRIISTRGDFDVLLRLRVVGFHLDFVVADHVTRVLVIDGQASFSAV